ncbi:MAG: hypothetical protein EBQ60_07630 [Actinobacteria bacterium]|nr:hypothetical protein [Actinomycetota bacterium]
MGLILCIGDVMLDVVIRINTEVNYGSDTPAKISTHGGGAAANVASWLAFSSHKVQLVSRVGDDPAGTAVMAELDKLGVQHGNIVIQGAQTGVVAVLVDKTGERTMFPESGANSGLNLSDLPALDNVSAVYLSGYSLLNPASTTGVVAMVNAITSAKFQLFLTQLQSEL